MTRPVPHTIPTSFGDVVIWGKTDILNDFFGSAAPDVLGAGVVRQTTRAGSSVRQYPGDPSPFSRSGGNRREYEETALSNGATPGKRFWCEYVTGVGPLAQRVVKQFTYVGSFSGLKEAARDTPVRDFKLRNASGTVVPVTAPVGP